MDPGFLLFVTIAFLVAFFDCLAFIVILFTLTEGNNDLNEAALSKKLQWHNTHTGLFTLG